MSNSPEQRLHRLNEIYQDFKMALNLYQSSIPVTPSESEAIQKQLEKSLATFRREIGALSTSTNSENPFPSDPSPLSAVPTSSVSGVRKAELQDLDQLAPLFDQYRQFYRRPAHLPAAREFIQKRLENRDSVIFLALARTSVPVGFTQLYPSLGSLSGKRIWILNDLFVHPDERKRGWGKALLSAAKEFALSTGAAQLQLCTEKTNTTAQALYASEGYQFDSEFMHLSLDLN